MGRALGALRGGELASVAHVNAELPQVAVFLSAACLDQHPGWFWGLISPSLKPAGSLGKAQATGFFHLIVCSFSLPVMNSPRVSGK